MSARFAVVYDGHCSVCKSLVSRLSEWDKDGALEIIPSQAPAVAARFPWISAAELDRSLQVVRLSDNRTWQGAAAIEVLSNAVPRAAPVSWIFKIPFMRPVAERLYALLARNRHRFGCSDHCRPL